MNVVIDKTVSYAVHTVKVSNVILNKSPKGDLIVSVPFSWLDANGATIRTGNNRYTGQQLIAQSPSVAPVVNAIALLVPTGISGNCSLIVDCMTAIQVYSDGTTWISTTLTQAQLVVAIAPITIDQITQTLTAFITSLTA